MHSRRMQSLYRRSRSYPSTMGALGYVMQVPEEEKYLNTKKELEAMLVGYLGGRAAEELCLIRSLQVLPMILSRQPRLQSHDHTVWYV